MTVNQQVPSPIGYAPPLRAAGIKMRQLTTSANVGAQRAFQQRSTTGPCVYQCLRQQQDSNATCWNTTPQRTAAFPASRLFCALAMPLQKVTSHWGANAVGRTRHQLGCTAIPSRRAYHSALHVQHSFPATKPGVTTEHVPTDMCPLNYLMHICSCASGLCFLPPCQLCLQLLKRQLAQILWQHGCMQAAAASHDQQGVRW